MERAHIVTAVLVSLVLLLSIGVVYQTLTRWQAERRVQELEYDVVASRDQSALLKERVEREVALRLEWWGDNASQPTLSCAESDWDDQTHLGSAMYYEWQRYVRIFTDFCQDADTLVEYECTTPDAPTERLIRCPEGCSRGACVQS